MGDKADSTNNSYIWETLNCDPSNIANIPKEKLNEDVCLNAIKENSSVFLHMPEEIKTEKICVEAYERARQEEYNPAYLSSIVEKIPYKDVLIDLLVKYSFCSEFDLILSAIPDKIFDQEIAETAVHLHEHSIKDIPDKFISEKMVNKVLEADINLISSVPDRYKTFEKCYEAIFAPSKNKDDLLATLRVIPHPELVAEVLFSKMYQNIPALHIAENIPKEAFNQSVAEILVGVDANCLPHIPFHLKDEEVCLKAIEKAKVIDPLFAIPKDSMTEKVCIKLVDKFPIAFEYILPESKKTPEICLKATIKDESLQKCVPKHIKEAEDLNIYRFGILALKQRNLEFNQIKDLYQGKRVEINYTIPTNNLSRMLRIQYNPQKKSLEYTDIPIQKEKISPGININKNKGMRL